MSKNTSVEYAQGLTNIKKVHQKHELNRWKEARDHRKRAATCRKEARDRGLKQYSTGDPCLYGHMAKRTVSTNYCIECSRMAYDMRHPDSRRNGGITKRQKKALAFIINYRNINGYSPSYAEIAKGLGLKYVGCVTNFVRRLTERGFITYTPDQPRSIRIVDA
jgi:repressor LexA